MSELCENKTSNVFDLISEFHETAIDDIFISITLLGGLLLFILLGYILIVDC